ncbi:hypothetical protein [Dongia sp.]|uniref:hypothetical protein n=1 Tax=Dongia sp. TaxID=1977262 RepID=UPI00375284B7
MDDEPTKQPATISALSGASYLSRFQVTGRKVGDRQRLLGDIGELIGDRNYGKLARRFKGIPTFKLEECYDKARSWPTNPPALFHKLVNEELKQPTT